MLIGGNRKYLAEDLAKGYYIEPTVIDATTFGKNFLPRVSAMLDSQQISEITEVVSSDTFKRPIYIDPRELFLTLETKKIISVRSTAFDGVVVGPSEAPISNVASLDSLNISSFVNEEIPVSDRPELTAADSCSFRRKRNAEWREFQINNIL